MPLRCYWVDEVSTYFASDNFPFSPFGSSESCDVSSLGRDFCHELAKVLTESQYIPELGDLILLRAETSKVPNMSH